MGVTNGSKGGQQDLIPNLFLDHLRCRNNCLGSTSLCGFDAKKKRECTLGWRLFKGGGGLTLGGVIFLGGSPPR